MTNIEVPLEGAYVVAVATPPRSASPFNQARPVLQGADGRCVRARVYTATGAAAGPVLTESELGDFAEGQQMLLLDRPVPARSGLVAWVFRSNFPDREAAISVLAAAGVVHHLGPGPDGARVALVDESNTQAVELRRRWCADAGERARAELRRGGWSEAERAAGLAHALAPGLDPDVLALLALTHEKVGRERRAKGLVTMARNSRGAEFAELTERALAALRTEFEPPAAARSDLQGLIWALTKRGRPIAPQRSARLVQSRAAA